MIEVIRKAYFKMTYGTMRKFRGVRYITKMHDEEPKLLAKEVDQDKGIHNKDLKCWSFEGGKGVISVHLKGMV